MSLQVCHACRSDRLWFDAQYELPNSGPIVNRFHCAGCGKTSTYLATSYASLTWTPVGRFLIPPDGELFPDWVSRAISRGESKHVLLWAIDGISLEEAETLAPHLRDGDVVSAGLIRTLVSYLPDTYSPVETCPPTQRQPVAKQEAKPKERYCGLCGRVGEKSQYAERLCCRVCGVWIGEVA